VLDAGPTCLASLPLPPILSFFIVFAPWNVEVELNGFCHGERRSLWAARRSSAAVAPQQRRSSAAVAHVGHKTLILL